jgi:hypothetical protein
VSLLEVIIAFVILTGVVVMVFALLHSSSTEYGNQSIHLALDDAARETLAKMAEELRLMGGNVQWRQPGLGQFWDPALEAPPRPTFERYLEVEFEVATGLTLSPAGGGPPQVTYGDRIRYRWVPLENPPGAQPNEIDDNSNGFVDEGYLEKTYWRTPPGGGAQQQLGPTIICRDVAGPHREGNPPQLTGFWFERDNANPNYVTVRIALQRRDPKNTLITRTAETSASRRN